MNYIVFARWFGLVSIILSLGILFNLENAREMAKHMVKSDSGYIMGGVLPVIFGSLALIFTDSSEPIWSLVVTLVGVAMLFAGVFRVIFVRQWQEVIARNIEKIPFLFSLFGLMFGLILLYVGYAVNFLGENSIPL